jgi:hypothetical protein
MSSSRETEPTAPLRSDRRLFLKEGLAAMAGVMLLGSPAFGSLLGVRVRQTPTETKEPAKAVKVEGGEGKAVDFVKPFLNERFEFDIVFLGATTATGLITFTKTGDSEYTASLDATTTSFVGAITTYRKVSLTSVMIILRPGGKYRFVTKKFVRKTIKTDETVETVNEFNYLHRRWTHARFENGKRVRGPRGRKIPPGVYYDDFVALLYNFRAQVYGEVKPGAKFTLTTMPWERTVTVKGKKVKKTATTVDVLVPPVEALDNADREWLQKVKGEYFVIVKLDKDVYGIPTGQAKFAGTKNLEPAGAWAKDAVLFGDVQCNRKY